MELVKPSYLKQNDFIHSQFKPFVNNDATKMKRGDIFMKTQNGFTLMNKNEIASYLAKQNVTRKITRLQVHHMDLPNYSTWEKTDKKVFSEPHFGRNIDIT